MQKSKFIISILGTLVMIYIMAVTGSKLKTDATPNGIINLEFANTTTKAATVLNAWKGDLISTAKINTYWDFAFLFFYGFLFYTICRWIQQKQPLTRIGKLGNYFAKLSIIAALLDVVENVFMLKVLANQHSEFQLVIMSLASYTKWFFVALIILYCVVGLVAVVIKRKSKIA